MWLVLLVMLVAQVVLHSGEVGISQSSVGEKMRCEEGWALLRLARTMPSPLWRGVWVALAMRSSMAITTSSRSSRPTRNTPLEVRAI